MKTKISLSLIVALVLTLLIISCKKNASNPGQNEIYSSTPNLPETPYDYKASLNDNLASLGRVLFYDKNLSLNNSVACASCHQQEKAFCDNLQFSVGLENVRTPRNSPSIFAKTSRVFWDGRASSLTDLALRPIKNHVEMKFENVEALAKKISGLGYYPPLFHQAFPQKGMIDTGMIQSALAEFLKNFNFSNNKFNRSSKGQESLSASEKLGKIVFFNKGLCINCHHIEPSNIIPFPNDSLNQGNGYGFTDDSHNTGLDETDTDLGVGAITHNSSDYGAFMIPALLNVEFTAPYMHDGRFKTLEEVVEHYNSGIKNNPNLDPILRGIDPNMTEEQFILLDTNHDGELEPSEISQFQPVKLGLTDAEKRGLVDFLRTLSDPSILSEPKFSNPFRLK